VSKIFHIAHQADWQAAQVAGSYRVASLEQEGFIHCSTTEQVAGVADRFYRGQTDLVLLHIDPQRLQAPLRYEAPAEAPAGNERFPHIYGPLNLDAVVAVQAFAAGAKEQNP
jgi:uncharacterized protein (DUF952 family)